MLRKRPARFPAWLAALLCAPAVPYGGQAAIEGVMMKGKGYAALAVRRRSGKIEVLERVVTSRFPRLVLLPVLRGIFIMVDMFTLGYWALSESSHRYQLDWGDEEPGENGPPPPGAEQSAGAQAAEYDDDDTPPAPPIGYGQMILMGISMLLAIFMFKVLPAIGATYIAGWLGLGGLAVEKAKLGLAIAYESAPSFQLQLIVNSIEGLIKFAVFAGYIWSVGRIREIGRVFEYHGAEHIVINAYEDQPDNQDMAFIQSHPVAHPRCGTSFIALMILLSIIMFTLLDWIIVQYLPAMADPVRHIPIWYARWPLRILGLPLLAGFSYEIIRAAFKYYGNPILRPLLRFGMLFQVLTVRRPSDDQVEVSLASFNRARSLTEAAEARAAAAS